LGRYEISGTEDSIATSLSMTQEFCIELILLSPFGRGFEFEFKETELNGIEFKCMLREENFLDRDDTTIFGKARFFLGKRARHISHGDEGRIKNKNKFLAVYCCLSGEENRTCLGAVLFFFLETKVH
jgi:hypothetical protein